jgi:wyosine [tRNA(Phe)-imidazoG37] synthetase (radical SAM superfamily)
MELRKLHLYALHGRAWRDNRYVYPVISRRSEGLSVGVNLNPDKTCNFDCIYCCVDRTIPATTTGVDLDVLEGELDQMLGWAASGEIFTVAPFDHTPPELRRINDIAFSGDGEPTAYPGFAQACEMAARLLDRHGLGEARIIIITNATLLHRPAVARALAFLDARPGEIWAKLDAGTEEYYRRVERTTIPLGRVLDNIAAAGRLRPIVIQSLFMRIDGQGPDDEEVAAYVQRLKQLAEAGCRIKLVQVYTVARQTAEAGISPLPDDQLDRIARQVAAAGLSARVYYGIV